MLLTLTAKRQVTFPAKVLQSLGAGMGNTIELVPSPEGFLLKMRLVDRSRLGLLRKKLQLPNKVSIFTISVKTRMSARYGIDMSILVRLVTGLPETDFEQTLQTLSAMVEKEGAQLYTSAMVIGEAYIALQHRYRVSKSDAQFGLMQALSSGLIKPVHGAATLQVITQAASGCGLMDRLVAHDYERSTLDVLTLDRKMAQLARA